MEWLIIIAVVVVFIWWYRKSKKSKREEIMREIGTSAIKGELIHFFQVCKEFSDKSDLVCIGSITDRPNGLVIASMDAGEAVERPFAMGDFYDNMKYSTFMNPSSADELIESMDYEKVRAVFGENVCLSTSPAFEDGIKFSITWQIPDGVSAANYINGLRDALAPYLLIESSKYNNGYLSVKL